MYTESLLRRVMKKGSCILLRHGQSVWNKKNIFTGWVDVPLSVKGIDEAMRAGQLLKNISIDRVFFSNLVRAQMTGMIALAGSKKTPYIVHPDSQKRFSIRNASREEEMIPCVIAQELNERMYGSFQGENKDTMKEKYGEEAFVQYRRSYAVPPPEGESLQQTYERAVPYFKNSILPYIEMGETVLISAHGNSLRSVVKFLENLSEEEILHLEIPTGEPILYHKEQKKWVKEIL